MKNFRFFAQDITNPITHMLLAFFFSFSSHVTKKLKKYFTEIQIKDEIDKNRENMGNRRTGRVSKKRIGAHLSKGSSGTDLNTEL